MFRESGSNTCLSNVWSTSAWWGYDLAAATEFFVELGLVLQGVGLVEGRWVDRVVGLEGVRADIATMQTPDGNGRLER